MDDDRRRARLARPCRVPAELALVLETAGVPVAALLGRAGLPPDALRAPGAWLSIDAYFALWDAIDEAVGEPTLGTRLGIEYPAHVLEPAFLALLGSRDLGEALGRLSRYKRTLCPETLSLERRAGRVEVRYDWPTAGRAPPAILVDAELSFLLHMARKATRQPLRSARVALTRRGDAAPFASLLDADVRLGARAGVLGFAAADLALPFATFNPALLAALDPALEAAQSVGAAVVEDAVAAVRSVLRRRLGDGEPSLLDVAGELGMSARTLQRQLRDAGTSFGELLQGVRRDRATFYLRQSELTLTEIAYLLGFDTPTSFFRAFARWTGQTPRAFRGGPAASAR